MPDTTNQDTFYPPVGFYFQMQFASQGVDHGASFQEVSGISAQMETEEVAEGPENRFAHRVPTRAKYENLVLKRGMMVKNTPLTQWCLETINGHLEQTIKPRDIVVHLLDETSKPIKTWTFHNAFPVKWEISDLKSMSSELVIEELEFSYNYFEAS